MKKFFIILTIAVIAFAMIGFFRNNNNTTKPNEETKTSTQTNESETEGNNSNSTNSDILNEKEAYAELVAQYTMALKEKWSGGDLNTNDMSFMMIDCYGSDPQKNIGYALLDLDNDNSKELIIATTNAITDDFYGKLIFDVYSLNEKGVPVKVIASTERNRFYYVGENKFANVGSNSAGDTVETTVKMENGKLMDMNYTTSSSNYVQLQLTLMK